MAASLASLSRRGAAVEEGWAKKEQELLAAALRERLEASPAGRARLAAHGAPPQQTHSMLPAIARQYLRLDTPQQTEHNSMTSRNDFRHKNHFIAGVCSGNPLFVRDTSLGGSLSVRGSKWVAASSTVDGVSLFDVKGAVKLMEGTQSELPKQWVPKPSSEPVLQLGCLNLRLLPDLTPNRALLWGTVLAVWTVAGVSVKAARTLGIKSADDVRDKCGDAMFPWALWCHDTLQPYREKLVAGQGALKNSELTQRLRAQMR